MQCIAFDQIKNLFVSDCKIVYDLLPFIRIGMDPCDNNICIF